MDIATSVHGVPIRLTEERWRHILERHPEVEALRDELLRTVTDPDAVVDFGAESLGVIRRLRDGLHIVVLYREVSQEDGFVITGLLTSRMERYLKREVLWTRPSST